MVVGLFEPAQHGLGRKAALDLERGVEARHRLFDRQARQVGGENLDVGVAFERRHGQGIGFLAGRSSGGPQTHLAARAGGGQGGHQFAREDVEDRAVAAEPGLAVQQSLDHRPAQRGDRLAPQGRQHGLDVVIALATGHRPQAVLGQMHPVARQPEAGARRQQGLKAIEILGRHDGD
ncbi:hypothetical protein D3C87_1605510 [compost metagenome]